MLTTPSKGFALSVNKHNVELGEMAEWLEGCITFEDTPISKPNVKDQLHDEGIYVSQDFAQQRIDDAWTELKRRQQFLGLLCPFRVEPTRLIRIRKWNAVPAYSFCLMLGLQVAYRDAFTKRFGTDFTEQGALFEELTAEALALIGWQIHSTGWSRSASDSIADKVVALATSLGEPHRVADVPKWTTERAKDGGLDVVCHLPFTDGRAGRPLFFVQCASGENWKEKRHTPNLKLWDKFLDLATEPRRGISHPFALLTDDFRRECNCDMLSLVLDRHRLSRPAKWVTKQWVSENLAKRLNTWTKSRLVALRSKRST
jgi:hypothetical protein